MNESANVYNINNITVLIDPPASAMPPKAAD